MECALLPHIPHTHPLLTMAKTTLVRFSFSFYTNQSHDVRERWYIIFVMRFSFHKCFRSPSFFYLLCFQFQFQLLMVMWWTKREFRNFFYSYSESFSFSEKGVQWCHGVMSTLEWTDGLDESNEWGSEWKFEAISLHCCSLSLSSRPLFCQRTEHSPQTCVVL